MNVICMYTLKKVNWDITPSFLDERYKATYCFSFMKTKANLLSKGIHGLRFGKLILFWTIAKTSIFDIRWYKEKNTIYSFSVHAWNSYQWNNVYNNNFIITYNIQRFVKCICSAWFIVVPPSLLFINVVLVCVFC